MCCFTVFIKKTKINQSLKSFCPTKQTCRSVTNIHLCEYMIYIVRNKVITYKGIYKICEAQLFFAHLVPGSLKHWFAF